MPVSGWWVTISDPYTAVMVVVTDFLTGVVSAVVIWAFLQRYLDKPVGVPEQAGAEA